jgi:ribose 5-phosphate isomerase B
MAMTANKIPGVRAAVANDTASARMSRAHNDANVLALGARLITPELAKEIVNIWLTTDFEGGRHQPRLDKISKIERTRRAK